MLASVAVGAGCSGCRRDGRQDERSEQLAPLTAPAAVASLEVPGFADAVTVIPVGVTRPAPVVVAVIGIGDTPEEQCAVWRELVGQRAFVVCPRGRPNIVTFEEPSSSDGGAGAETAADESDRAAASPESEDDEAPRAPPAATVTRQVGFIFPDVPSLERELAAALDALRDRWGPYVAGGEVVYAGFSRGAFLGAQLAAKEPGRFKRVVLIEGGHSPWDEARTLAFARGGGKRVLFACGQPSCTEDAQAAARVLAGQGVETRIVNGEGEGHGYKRQVKEEIRRALPWVVEGDPLWRELFARAEGR